jgi:hypothetical protein
VTDDLFDRTLEQRAGPTVGVLVAVVGALDVDMGFDAVENGVEPLMLLAQLAFQTDLLGDVARQQHIAGLALLAPELAGDRSLVPAIATGLGQAVTPAIVAAVQARGLQPGSDDLGRSRRQELGVMLADQLGRRSGERGLARRARLGDPALGIDLEQHVWHGLEDGGQMVAGGQHRTAHRLGHPLGPEPLLDLGPGQGKQQQRHQQAHHQHQRRISLLDRQHEVVAGAADQGPAPPANLELELLAHELRGLIRNGLAAESQLAATGAGLGGIVELDGQRLPSGRQQLAEQVLVAQAGADEADQQRPPLLDGLRQRAAAIERLVDQETGERVRPLIHRQLDLGAELGIAAVARALERIAPLGTVPGIDAECDPVLFGDRRQIRHDDVEIALSRWLEHEILPAQHALRLDQLGQLLATGGAQVDQVGEAGVTLLQPQSVAHALPGLGADQRVLAGIGLGTAQDLGQANQMGVQGGLELAAAQQEAGFAGGTDPALAEAVQAQGQGQAYEQDQP